MLCSDHHGLEELLQPLIRRVDTELRVDTKAEMLMRPNSSRQQEAG